MLAVTALRIANLPELLPRDKPPAPKAKTPKGPPRVKAGPDAKGFSLAP